MSLKDSFSQAVKEILKKDGLVGDDLSKQQGKKTELDRYLEPANAIVEEKKVVAEQPKESSVEQPAPQSAATYTPPVTNTAQRTTQQAPRPIAQITRPITSTSNDSSNHDTEELTVISRNTIIEGNIRSFANVDIEGSIKGDIQITKNANISGKVVGNLDCNNASMMGSQMQGNVSSKGQVRFDRDSLILGNINAQYLDMNGKVRGNIDISGKAEFKSDAYILGDINVSTLTVLEGATISGHVNTTFLQETPSAIFPEMISLSELG